MSASIINSRKRYSLNGLVSVIAIIVASNCTMPDVVSTQDNESDDDDSNDITDVYFTSRATSCTDYVSVSYSYVSDVQNNTDYDGDIFISATSEECQISSNAIPNHDFNATGSFVTPVDEQVQTYTITATPVAASSTTALSLTYDNAIFLNGVKLDLLAAGCYGVGDGKIGCTDINAEYRYDPMAATSDFGTDEHHAHTQPDGTYHYHGNPLAMFDQTNPTEASPVIGFAADGFPIFGSYIDDDGDIRKAISGYELKEGTRSGGPGGEYDGTFIDDYEFTDAGDLDECNGMYQDGVYGYVITDTYPHVLGCFTGTPDSSFRK